MSGERRESSPPKTQGIRNRSKKRYWIDDRETHRKELESQGGEYAPNVTNRWPKKNFSSHMFCVPRENVKN